MELESDTYDVVVLGTGLAESIAAASLAKIGKSVLHLDPNEYYGGEQASLTLDEFESWSLARSGLGSGSGCPVSELSETPGAGPSYASCQRTRYTRARSTPTPLSQSPDLERDRRRYALSLFPAVLPSRGPLITTLIASDVSKYVSFRLLDGVSVWQRGDGEGESDGGEPRRVPGSKEDVFKDKTVSLLDKRRLMKFLMFAGGDFENDDVLKGRENMRLLDVLRSTFQLPPHLADAIAYAVAYAPGPSEPFLPALERARRYLRSVGRYGSSAFLVGQYGGAGEVAQGFCRACAVFGGTYVLGASAVPESIVIEPEDEPEDESSRRQVARIKLPCHPRAITAKYVVGSRAHLLGLADSGQPRHTVTTAHGIAVLPTMPSVLRRATPGAGPDDETEPAPAPEADDTGVVVFPPTEESKSGLVRALIMGEGTGSCPAGQYVVYLSTRVEDDDVSTVDAGAVLAPFLTRLLGGGQEPLFEGYYLAHRDLPHRHRPPQPTPSSPPVDSPLVTAAASPARVSTATASMPSPLVVLEPYAGSEMVTEGLDWEAEQGEGAFWAVVGSKGDGPGFFDKLEGDDDERGDEE